MSSKKKLIRILSVMIGLIALCLIYSPISQAQNWAALPPYNTLWPLWSPTLAPIDATTGLPVPIVSELTPGTVLPVQPGLTWDPSAPNPWLLYNSPLGMAYYDPIDGVNLWPPPYLLGSAGPLPLLLPNDYAFLPPTDAAWITTNVPLANAAAYAYLMTVPAPIFGPAVAPTFAPTATPVFGPTATPVFGPTATPVFGPTATPVFGPTFTPIIGGVPLFLAASALVPPPIAPAVVPPPVPTIIAPPPVPTVVVPPPVPTGVVPTVVVPPLTTAIPAAISGLFFPFI